MVPQMSDGAPNSDAKYSASTLADVRIFMPQLSFHAPSEPAAGASAVVIAPVRAGRMLVSLLSH